jgi:hypothetical protein
MTEPSEPQEPQEPQEPVEAPESPQEPQDEPDRRGAEDGDPYPPEASEEPVSRGLSEHEFERAAKKLEGAVKRYRAQVAEFMEVSDQPLIESKLDLDFCPGYIFHPQAVPLTEEQEAFARVILGEPIEPSFPQDPHRSECPTCEGWGQVKTGSKVAQQNVVRCDRCNGHGFLRDGQAPAEVSVPNNGPVEPANVVLTPEEQSDEDAWGTPRSHPDWGKSPQYRSPNWQAELAAYKQGLAPPIEPVVPLAG